MPRLATGVSASETRKLLAGLVVNGLVELVGEEEERLRLAPHLGELLVKAMAPVSVDLPGEGTEQVTAQVTEQVVQVVLASQGEQSRAAMLGLTPKDAQHDQATSASIVVFLYKASRSLL